MILLPSNVGEDRQSYDPPPPERWVAKRDRKV